MAFGFPAYHTEQYTSEPGIDLQRIVKETLTHLSWSIRKEDSEEMLASTSMNIRSWGEKVILTFGPDNSLTVTSKCALPTQCVDWGKNRSNVVRFIGELKQRAEQEKSQSSE